MSPRRDTPRPPLIARYENFSHERQTAFGAGLIGGLVTGSSATALFWAQAPSDVGAAMADAGVVAAVVTVGSYPMSYLADLM